MATVLVSFIGNGNLTGGAYFSTDYYFEGETTPRNSQIFGSVLLQHLIDNGKKVDSWLIMGTKESIWFDLIDIIQNPNLTAEETKLQNLLFDNAFNSRTDESQIKPEHLTDWQGVLNNRLTNTKIICRLVGDASTIPSQELIFNSLNEVIKKGDEIVFDVTHGLRSQPIITTFILMYLRYSKEIKIENIRFYYASLDSTKKIGTVHNLDFCNELMNATEAVAIFEQTGNFVKLGDSLTLNKNEVEKVSFSNEMNKPDKRTATKVLNELKGKSGSLNPLQKTLEPLLEETLDWQGKSSLVEVYQRKADFAFEHQQYFQAIALLWEALLLAGCKNFNIPNPTTFSARKQAEDKINESLDSADKKTFQIIDYLRNAVMHGTDVEPSRVKQDVENAIKNEQDFRAIFKKGQALLKNLLN